MVTSVSGGGRGGAAVRAYEPGEAKGEGWVSEIEEGLELAYAKEEELSIRDDKDTLNQDIPSAYTSQSR